MPKTLSPAEIERFREDLCACATRLFAERGVAGVTMRALARKLGCSAMTPYRYFESKEELFDAVRVSAFRRLSERIERTAALYPDPIERLRHVGRAYVAFALDEPHAYRIMFQLDRDAPLPDDADDQNELKRGWVIMRDTVGEAIAAGRLVGDPNTVAHIQWLALHGLVALHLSDRLAMDRTLAELVDPVIETTIRGSEARPLRQPSALEPPT